MTNVGVQDQNGQQQFSGEQQIVEKGGESQIINYPLVLKFVSSELPPAPSIELNKTQDEQYEVKFDSSLQEVQI